MDDYRKVQIADLDRKIEETQSLLSDPEMAEMAKAEIENLDRRKAGYSENFRN